jgi:hypothetical protein
MGDGGWRRAVGGLLSLRPHNPVLKIGLEDDEQPQLMSPCVSQLHKEGKLVPNAPHEDLAATS